MLGRCIHWIERFPPDNINDVIAVGVHRRDVATGTRIMQYPSSDVDDIDVGETVQFGHDLRGTAAQPHTGINLALL